MKTPIKQSPHLTTAQLTKALLFTLSAGDIIVSNCIKADGESIFVVRLNEVTDRSALWSQALAAGANGRLCHITRNRAAAGDRSSGQNRESARQKQLLAIAANGGDAAECAAHSLFVEFGIAAGLHEEFSPTP